MFNGRRQPSRGGTSRIRRDCQVRFCEGLGVKFPGPTRQPRPCRDARYRRKADVSQANRKQLRRTVHSDLNRLPTAGRLWCAHVAPCVSVDCYRPIAAAGRRAGCAGS